MCPEPLLRFRICKLPDIRPFGAIKTGVILPSLNANLAQTHPYTCLFQLTSVDSSLLSAIIQIIF
jgi:hypothetical protein